MTSQTTQLDAQISAYLGEGPGAFPSEWREAIASAAEETAQRRQSTDWRAILDRRWPRLAIVAVVIGLLAALVTPLVGRPQLEPRPTTGPLVVPSQPTLLPWTSDALREAYPVPLRAEPSGGADVVDAVPLPSDPGGGWQEFAWRDQPGDAAPGRDPRVDLVKIEFFQSMKAGCLHPDQLCVFYAPAQLLETPLPDPRVEWISYGIVVDRDGDGSPDGQVGLDNMPGGLFRAWYTDATTGATKVVLGHGNSWPDGAYGESEAPMAGRGTRPGRGYLWISSDLAGTDANPHGNFYLWAALMRDGRLVSVDYAPDVGWLTVPDEP